MSDGALIRSYIPSDLLAIQRIHDESSLDYRLPNLGRLPINKVLEIEGKVRAAYGMAHVFESYMWLDKSSWADAEQKWVAIKSLDREATEATRNLGVDSIFCCIPPGYERFGRRISDAQDGLGFTKLRSDWGIYAKRVGDKS